MSRLLGNRYFVAKALHLQNVELSNPRRIKKVQSIELKFLGTVNHAMNTKYRRHTDASRGYDQN